MRCAHLAMYVCVCKPVLRTLSARPGGYHLACQDQGSLEHRGDPVLQPVVASNLAHWQSHWYLPAKACGLEQTRLARQHSPLSCNRLAEDVQSDKEFARPNCRGM